MLIETGAYQIDSLSLFLAFSGFAGIMISIYIFKYRESPGITYLSLLQFSTAIWTIFYALEYSATDLPTRLLWSKLSYLGIAFIPVWFYFFSINFSERRKTVSSRQIGLIIPIPVIFIVLVFTNDFHHWHWHSARIDWINHTTIYQYGPVFWLIFIFIYSFLFLGIVNIIKLIRRYSRQIHHSVWLLIIASLFPTLGNIMYVFKLNPIPGFDWTPTCFFVTGIILTYINIRFGTVDLVPFARQKLIDVMDDGFLLLDIHYRIADINQSLLNLIGRPRDQVIGKDVIEIFPSRKPIIEHLKKTKEIFHFEFTTDISTENRILDMRSSPLLDKNNVPGGQLLIFRDITTLKKHEETILETNSILKSEIAENEKLIVDLDNFAHTVAHDLKNSIGSIISLSEMIRDDLENEEPESIPAYNKIILSSARKTLYIMEELLTMSTVRQEDITKEQVEMKAVINESLKRLSEDIKQNQVTILKPDQWPVIKAIPSWIEEVWVNFISNAIKYGGTPPVIKLGVDHLHPQGKIKFWIRDNGNGLSKTDQEKLFIQFTRLETSKVTGTGLGLSIVKRIIEKLGGEVGVFSNAVPGEGCLFYFILPEN